MGYNIIRQGKEKKSKINPLNILKEAFPMYCSEGIEPQTSCSVDRYIIITNLRYCNVIG